MGRERFGHLPVNGRKRRRRIGDQRTTDFVRGGGTKNILEEEGERDQSEEEEGTNGVGKPVEQELFVARNGNDTHVLQLEKSEGEEWGK